MTRSFLGLSGELGFLDSLALVSLVDSLLSELLVDLEVLEIISKGLDLAPLSGGWKSKDTFLGVLAGILELISGGVVDLSLLWLVSVSWEKDKFGLVLGQSLNVGGHGFGVLVVSSMVDSDSNGSGKDLGESSSLNFLEREASSELDLVTISPSLSENNWSKSADWCGSKVSSSSSSLLSSKLFVGWLVEEALHSVLPMLSQMSALKDVIVFYHVAY